jgi:hypothetical protein
LPLEIKPVIKPGISMTSTHKQMLFGFLSAAGLLGTWYFNVQFMHEGGASGAARFIRDSYANNASSSIGNDVAVAAVTFLVWSYFEAKRLAMKLWWLFISLTIGVALACAFPLFLLLRERKLAAT